MVVRLYYNMDSVSDISGISSTFGHKVIHKTYISGIAGHWGIQIGTPTCYWLGDPLPMILAHTCHSCAGVCVCVCKHRQADTHVIFLCTYIHVLDQMNQSLCMHKYIWIYEWRLYDTCCGYYVTVWLSVYIEYVYDIFSRLCLAQFVHVGPWDLKPIATRSYWYVEAQAIIDIHHRAKTHPAALAAICNGAACSAAWRICGKATSSVECSHGHSIDPKCSKWDGVFTKQFSYISLKKAKR